MFTICAIDAGTTAPADSFPRAALSPVAGDLTIQAPRPTLVCD